MYRLLTIEERLLFYLPSDSMHGGADGGVGLCDVGRGACSSVSNMISDINTNLSLQRAH